MAERRHARFCRRFPLLPLFPRPNPFRRALGPLMEARHDLSEPWITALDKTLERLAVVELHGARVERAGLVHLDAADLANAVTETLGLSAAGDLDGLFNGWRVAENNTFTTETE